MTIECPKCKTNNPDSQKFCGECATPLPHDVDLTEPFTKTMETPFTDFARGSTFAHETGHIFFGHAINI